MLKKLGVANAAIFLSLTLGGCTGASLYTPLPQSHFAPPNSDIDRLDHVNATVTQSYIMPFQTPAGAPNAIMQRDAYFEALKSSGGDLIVDGDFTVKTTLIPLLFVNIVTVEGTLEGTAAKFIRAGSRPKQ